MMNPVEFINLLSAIMTVVLAILLLKMLFKLDVNQASRKKSKKNDNKYYLGL